jgi:hypothetical protein
LNASVANHPTITPKELLTVPSAVRRCCCASGEADQRECIVDINPPTRVVCIDGSERTRLLVRFNVGVRVARTVEIKRIDLDYFEDADTE